MSAAIGRGPADDTLDDYIDPTAALDASLNCPLPGHDMVYIVVDFVCDEYDYDSCS